MTNPAALYLEQPLEIDDARRAAKRMAEIRREGEDAHERAVEAAAEKERDYRKALSEAYLRAPDGMTAAQREAWARAEVADKSYERDVAEGMAKVCAERLRGLEGERSMLKSLMEWSARMRLDERPAA